MLDWNFAHSAKCWPSRSAVSHQVLARPIRGVSQVLASVGQDLPARYRAHKQPERCGAQIPVRHERERVEIGALRTRRALLGVGLPGDGVSVSACGWVAAARGFRFAWARPRSLNPKCWPSREWC